MIAPETWFGLIMGFLVALLFEKHYIGRVSVLPNVAGIFFLLAPHWNIIHQYLKYWTYAGVVLGLIALLFILNKKKLPAIVYDLTYSFYSGKTIMGIFTSIILFKELFPNALFSFGHHVIMVIMILTIWFIGVRYLDNAYPFKRIFSK